LLSEAITDVREQLLPAFLHRTIHHRPGLECEEEPLAFLKNLQQVADKVVHDGRRRCSLPAGRRQGLVGGCTCLFAEPLVQSEKQSFLVPKSPVHGTHGGVRPLGDFGHAGTVEPTFRNHLFRGVEHPDEAFSRARLLWRAYPLQERG